MSREHRDSTSSAAKREQIVAVFNAEDLRSFEIDLPNSILVGAHRTLFMKNAEQSICGIDNFVMAVTAAGIGPG
jgi:hypothetical protein